MATFVTKLIPSPNFNKELKDGVLSSVSDKVVARVNSKSKSIASEIGDFLVETFETTEVAKELRSPKSDLQAHLGLSSSNANELVNGMANIIKNSVRVVAKRKRLSGVIQIRAIESDFEAFRSLPSAQYISKPSNVTIPVIDWMLLDPNIDVGQAAYDIVFKGEENGKFDSRISSSRSGRAIMVSLETLGGRGGYVLPDIIRGDFGKNFIELAIARQEIAKVASIIVIGLM